MTDGQPVAFAVAMKQFFGFKPGETIAEFQRELKELTPEDRADFVQMLAGVGVKTK